MLIVLCPFAVVFGKYLNGYDSELWLRKTYVVSLTHNKKNWDGIKVNTLWGKHLKWVYDTYNLVKLILFFNLSNK